MPTLSWTQRRENGVTLVEAVVESTDPTGPTAVTVQSTLDGPVWPPRSEGVPVAGWDDARYGTTIEPHGRLAVGFASPAAPCEPPIELVTHEPAEDVVEHERSVDAADVLRALGDPTPPREAVPSSVPEQRLPEASLAPSDSDADTDASQ